jgi:hypothetical protein
MRMENPVSWACGGRAKTTASPLGTSQSLHSLYIHCTVVANVTVLLLHMRRSIHTSSKVVTPSVTIYAPMIYTAPCVMFLMRSDSLRWEVEEGGGGLALEIESFLAPFKWHVPIGDCHLGPKNSIFTLPAKSGNLREVSANIFYKK